MTNQLISIVQPNIPAPDFSLISAMSKRVKLSDYRDNHNVVLYFLRAFNCPPCRVFASRLVEYEADISARFGKIIVIGPGTKAQAEKLAKAIDPNNKIAILHDGTGEVYDLVIDKMGIIRHEVQAINANRWFTIEAVESVIKQLDSLGSARTTE
jgi:thiol-disulfide isomerase/thioredoxin